MILKVTSRPPNVTERFGLGLLLSIDDQRFMNVDWLEMSEP